MALLRRIPRRAAAQQDSLDDAARVAPDRLAAYSRAGDYYDGDQRTRLTDRQRRYLEASGLAFRENFCEPVVDVLVERLSVSGLSCLDDEVDEWARDALPRFDALQGLVYHEAVLKGDAYVIVDWDAPAGAPRFVFNPPEMVNCPFVEDHGWASKVWETDVVGPQNERGRRVQRLNVYRPDQVEKWYRLGGGTAGGGWERWYDAAGDPWPVPWLDRDGRPLGLAVIHFRHRSHGRSYGSSELANVIPQQDELNKLLLDLFELMDYQAAPYRYATGVNADNAVVNPEPGRMATTPNENASFGQLDAANPDGLLRAVEQCLSRIARRSRTPLHLLTGGDMPSGEALRSAEAGLVAKALAAQVPFGDAWEEAVGIAHRLSLARGDGVPGTGAERWTTAWVNPYSRSDKEDAEVGIMLAELGVSRHTILTRLGYDPEREEAHRATEREALGEGVGRLLDGGAGA